MPRPTEVLDYRGSFIGTIAGALLGGKAGALLGGALGSTVNSQSKVPLERAVADLLAANGLQLESLIRIAKNNVQVMFTLPNGSYWYFSAISAFDIGWTPEQLDDALYDAIVTELATWIRIHNG